jgi:uncharacterized protein (DUF2345 family)
MANDTFPVQTSISGKGKNQKVVAQLDLTSLEDALSPVLTPGSDLVETDASRPVVANPTKGPHRYTIYVPFNDGSRLSLGNGVPDKGQAGITADTLSHIHLNAYGPGHGTTLSLGLPTLHVGSMVNKFTTGYSLHTNGASHTVADKQIGIYSMHKGTAIGAKENISIFSAEGKFTAQAKEEVAITAKKSVTISAELESPFENASTWAKVLAVGRVAAAIADFSTGPATAAYGEDAGTAAEAGAGAGGSIEGVPNEASESIADYVIKRAGDKISTAMSHLEATIALILTARKNIKAPDEAKTGWKPVATWGKFGFSVVAELLALKGDYIDKPNEEGCVNLTASKNVTIDSDHSFKATSSSVAINGIKSASVTGTLSASLKAHKSASVFGGFGASVKGLAGKVEIGSDFKEVEITGKKEVKITSEAEKVLIAGEEDVQLNSVKGHAYVHGLEGAYIGAGKGQGFGITAKPESLALGTLANADNFKSTAADACYTVMRFTDKIIQLQSGSDSKAFLRTGGFDLKTKAVKVDAEDTVKIKANNKILLG